MDILTNFMANALPGLPPWLPPVMLAPFIGSFMGVLIQRLPEGRPIVMSRSACDRCGHRLGIRDLVPIISYVARRGRCGYCNEPIGSFPLAIEFAALGVAAWAAVTVSPGDLWAACLLGWTLLTLSWIDVRTMILPDVLTLPLIAAGLAVNALTDPGSLLNHGIAAVLGYGVLAAVAWSYRKFRGRDGLGLGDAKLLAAIGAWLGPGLLPFTVFVAACLGLLAAGAAMARGRHITAATAIPFGPCLAFAAWLLWLYGDQIDDWLTG